MTRTDEPTVTSLLEALNQNWSHARHLETERLWFTNVYAMVVVGTLTFLGQFGTPQQSYLVFLFLFMFSILGLILTQIDNDFNNHMTGIQRIIEKLYLDEYMGYPTSYGKGLSPWKILRVRHVFIGFYTVMILVWSYLL